MADKTQTELSHSRMQTLETALSNAVNNTSKKVKGNGYTVFELVQVFTRMIYKYNKLGIDQQHADYGDAPPQKMEVVN